MADPGDADVVALEGAAGDLLATIMRLEGFDFALVGGLAVMIRLGGAHRVTNDLDGVFDNADEDTAAILVTAGVADPTEDSAGILVDGTKLDVIDTQPLPPVVEEVVPDPGGRLFVCAHRYAYEAATPLVIASAGTTATIHVATPAALIACKACSTDIAPPELQFDRTGPCACAARFRPPSSAGLWRKQIGANRVDRVDRVDHGFWRTAQQRRNRSSGRRNDPGGDASK